VGEELMGKLTDVVTNGNILEVDRAQVVSLGEDGQIIMIPYTLTGDDDTIHLPVRHILSITKSMPEAAESFLESANIDTDTDETPALDPEDTFSL
jgi:flagellar biosynthesis regulator FlbT